MENIRITPAKGRITYHFAPVDQATRSQLSEGGNHVLNPQGGGNREKNRQQKQILDYIQGYNDTRKVTGVTA